MQLIDCSTAPGHLVMVYFAMFSTINDNILCKIREGGNLFAFLRPLILDFWTPPPETQPKRMGEQEYFFKNEEKNFVPKLHEMAIKSV